MAHMCINWSIQTPQKAHNNYDEGGMKHKHKIHYDIIMLLDLS